jgi:hypothetical protein|tara:strand:+ start:240 stop:932 length:693 start_codon:yes stop_codon:yes gene_type:complete
MLQEISSKYYPMWNLKFRNKILNFLKKENIVSNNFFELEQLHKYISHDMTIDKDFPSGVNEVTTALYDIDWGEVYYDFILFIYSILEYDFYFQEEPNVRVHCPQKDKHKDFRYWHNDSEKGHPPEELNIWMSLTENEECSFELLNSKNNIKEVNSNLSSFLIFNDGSDDVVKHSYRPVLNETRVSIETRINPKEKYVGGYVGTGRMKAEFKPGGHFGYDIKLASEIFNEV